MEKAIVIMSTYNGERYVHEQIDSILNQEGVEVSLVVRDDGSADNTQAILKEYSSAHSNVKPMFQHNVGCKKSFYLAAKTAAAQDGDYFAFSDQDDFWMPDKLATAIGYIKIEEEKNPSIPFLYFCAPDIVDKDLNPLGKAWNNSHLLTFEEALIAQPCAGCTMVFNRKALELFLIGNPDRMSMHDSWMYKTVLACSGRIIEDAAPHIKYRQHGNNVIGTGSFSSRWQRRFSNFTSNSCYRSGQAKAILDTYKDVMPEKTKKTALLLGYYKENGLGGKMQIVFSKAFKTKDRIHNLLFKTAILFNRY